MDFSKITQKFSVFKPTKKTNTDKTTEPIKKSMEGININHLKGEPTKDEFKSSERVLKYSEDMVKAKTSEKLLNATKGLTEALVDNPYAKNINSKVSKYTRDFIKDNGLYVPSSSEEAAFKGYYQRLKEGKTIYQRIEGFDISIKEQYGKYKNYIPENISYLLSKLPKENLAVLSDNTIYYLFSINALRSLDRLETGIESNKYTFLVLSGLTEEKNRKTFLIAQENKEFLKSLKTCLTFQGDEKLLKDMMIKFIESDEEKKAEIIAKHKN